MTTLVAAALLVAALSSTDAAGASSIFLPGRFTDDPATGVPSVQHTRHEPAYQPNDPTYRRAGYVHHRLETRGLDGSRATHRTYEMWGEPPLPNRRVYLWAPSPPYGNAYPVGPPAWWIWPGGHDGALR